MEFRTQKAAFALIALASASFAQQPFRYQVRHDHLYKGREGALTITAKGISFQETGKRKHAWEWEYQEIQQLEIAPRFLKVLTYQDNRWKLGADRAYRFDLRGDGTFSSAYGFLKGRLDQRLVAVLPDAGIDPLWEIPAKHLLRFGGSQGVLVAGEDGISYKTDKPDESRTWRFEDIENISSSGPFQLTITTYERALAHYGSRKGFNFQLKQRLEEARYNELWKRINESKGLAVLTLYKERKQ